MMFTKTQGQELIDNTDSWWTTINNVNGYKFFSKTNLSKYIFFPAAGYWINSTCNDTGSDGYYWSTILYREDSSINPWLLCFDSSKVTILHAIGVDRPRGRSIRAIQSIN